MKRLLSVSICLALFLCAPVPLEADVAPWERLSAKGDRIGVVIAKGGEKTEAVDGVLTAKGAVGEATVVRTRLVPHEVGKQKVSRVKKIREQGSQKYFFQGAEPARDYLHRELGAKLERTRSWMGDEKASSALFEASIYLVRAHLDVGENDEAFRQMKSLVAAFPAHRPEGEAFPPEVVELWTEAAREVATAQSLLRLPRDSECRLKVNGAKWNQERLVVAPNRLYLVGYQCGDDGQRWSRWVGASKAEERAVVIYHGALNADGLATKLEQMAARRHLDAAVYVGPCQNYEVCLGVYGDEFTLQPYDTDQAGEALEELSGVRGSS